MANTVGTIYDNCLAQIVSDLPVDFQELPFVHDVSLNDSRRLDKGYGLRFLDGPFSDTLTREYTIDQGFEMVLTRTNPRQDNDEDLITAEKFLYDKADDVLAALVGTKAGSPGIVLLVSQPSFLEPELLQDNKYVALRVQFIIKYRRALTGV